MVVASLHSCRWPTQLPASEQVIVQMLNGLTALNANVAHQTPAAISISRLVGKFRRNGVHARKERRVCGCVAKICRGANVFTRQDLQV